MPKNPWGNQAASVMQQALALQRLLTDPFDDGRPNRPGDDSIRQVEDPLTPLMGSAATVGAAKAARVAAPQVARLAADEVGGLKSNWSNLKRAMQGATDNPLENSPKDYGKLVRSLGPNIRSTAIDLAGAHSADEFATQDVHQMVDRLIRTEKAPPVTTKLVPGLLDNGRWGSFNTGTRAIELDPSLSAKGSNNRLLGTGTHEALHALDTRPHEKVRYQEYLKNGVSKNIDLKNAGMLSRVDSYAFGPGGSIVPMPSPLNDVLYYLRKNPGEMKNLPAFLQDAIRNNPTISRAGQADGVWGEAIRSLPKSRWSINEIIGSDLARFYRIADGNRGFNGTNPWLIQKWNSTGHLPPPYGSDLEIAPYRLARREVALGGGDIHNDWFKEFPDLRYAKEEYTAPIRSGKNFVAPAKDSSWKGIKALTGGTAGAAAAGASKVGYDAYQEHRKVKAIAKAQKEKYGPGY